MVKLIISQVLTCIKFIPAFFTKKLCCVYADVPYGFTGIKLNCISIDNLFDQIFFCV